MTKVVYRPEIDGLRAVAVVSVVLFHAAMGIAGGYIGVDVFFVVSGYLITTFILNEQSAGTFRLVGFWERRVRRILPAMVLVVLTCVGAGWVMLFPADFDKFGQSVAAQGLLLSNVYFWKETGYFSPSETQPLLHTWSLAVEEQFYLLFPFFLLALRRISRLSLARVFGGCALLSFCLSAYSAYAHPLSAFYLLPSRAWELLLGALLAAWSGSGKTVRCVNECLSVGGLAGILVAAIFYDRDTRFPGVAALLPCLGAGAIIWSNSTALTLVGKLLARRPFVFVGLISYSLYLWHWPMLIFLGYWAPDKLSMSARMAAIAASIVLSILSWKFVETPFRKRAILTSRPGIFAFAGGSLATLLIAGLLIHLGHGIASRWRPEALRYLAGQQEEDFRVELDLAAVRQGKLVEIGRKGTDLPIDLLVWGDSHAMSVLHVLDRMCAESRVRGVAATHSSTAPLLDIVSKSKYSLREGSIPYNQAVVDFVRTGHVKNVLLVAAWSWYLPTTENERSKSEFNQALIKTIDQLRRAGAKIFIMKDVPHHDYDVPRVLAITAERGGDPKKLGVPIKEERARGLYVNELIDKISGDSVVVLDPVPLFADRTGLCRVERDGHALYWDNNHLSIHGAMQLRPLFQPIFR